MANLDREEIIRRLRVIAELKPEDASPEFLLPNSWSLSDLCRQAADCLMEEGAFADLARYGE